MANSRSSRSRSRSRSLSKGREEGNTPSRKSKRIRSNSPPFSPNNNKKGRKPLGNISSNATPTRTLSSPLPSKSTTAVATNKMMREAADASNENHQTPNTSRGRTKKRYPSNNASEKPSPSYSARKSVSPNTAFRTAPPPKINDRVRVYFDAVTDMFGENRKGGRGFYFGTIRTVQQKRKRTSKFTGSDKKYKLLVDFDNGETSEQFDYPDIQETVERIIPSCEGSTVLMGELTGDFAADTNPERLDVGDLVFCYYQGLCELHRGRVAAVDETNKTCDIAYDDNEYECGVPIGKQFITLVEDGSLYNHWMGDLTMTFPLGTSKRRAEVTIKLLSEEENVVGLEHSNGTIEKQKYDRVARELFEQVKGRATKVLEWPTDLGEKILSPRASHSKRQRTGKESQQKATKPATSRRRIESTLKSMPHHFEQDPWMSDFSVEEDESDEEEEQAPLKEMSNSIRSTFWKALNSREPHFGAELLHTMTSVHNQLPNSQLCKDLVTLLWKGPVYQSVPYPDLVRMEMVDQYLDLLKTKRGMATKLTEALEPTFVKAFLEQVETAASIYCVEGDETRFSSATVQRIGQTLNVKNSGASLFGYLLQQQLKGYKSMIAEEGHRSRKDMDEFNKLLCGRVLTRQIINEPGSTQTLKDAVRAEFSILFHYGHYLTYDFPAPPQNTGASADAVPPHATSDDREFVGTEVRRLVRYMGRIVCYLSWVYSIDQGKDLYDAKYLIRDTVEAFCQSSSFDPCIFVAAEVKGATKQQKMLRQHLARIKQYFALSLDKRIAGMLGREVAIALDVPLEQV